MDKPQTDIREKIRAEALALGFDVCRFTPAHLPERIGQHLQTAIADGHHGTMDWLATRTDERSQPQTLWEGAKTVIMLGVNYGPEDDPLARLEWRDRGNISVYAQNEDYHDIIKKRLKQLGRWLGHEFETELKVFVDTAPVAEKPLAAQAGLGWQGKHTNLVSREFGSWLFLGAIYTALELPGDEPETDHCGSCRACLDICPTDAFPAPYRLDARACISYLTIEHKEPIPEQYRAKMGNRIYGCDDCLTVCPWNKFAAEAREAKLIAREELRAPTLAELSTLDDEVFRALFRKSPIKRIGRDRFIRNVMIAMGNSGDTSLLSAIEARLSDPSPLVRGMAVWAWAQLGGAAERLHKLRENEEEPHVRAELETALK
ncbi:tRNA epoxyqueuosine(34) reductase QueG [Parvularcula marina]|uniref:Epoxyqueuosine reductase n=1 Tax=Parvularcula marina TaxID=2292771 RepID=A0A371RHV8_9PROT|nr:tRNA epoxyqueuosine(34) reductase QueG [Parvularcula marina]RFB05020.1 tRNA epoxyqueuosine(34) reductase QueG [Parvularcula marina]